MHAHAVDDMRGAIAAIPRLLSLRETIVLADITDKEKEIRNDINRGVVPAATVIRIDNAHLCFNWPYVVTFAAVYGNHFLDSMELRKVALEKVFGVANAHPCAHALTRHAWSHILSDCEATVAIDDFLEINLRKACTAVRPRLNLYADGLDRVEEKDSVLGGAAVFRDTRLSVLHIGKLATRGERVETILEDYPALTKDDVEFAKLYYRARPPIGRPPRGVVGNVEHEIR